MVQNDQDTSLEDELVLEFEKRKQNTQQSLDREGELPSLPNNPILGSPSSNLSEHIFIAPGQKRNFMIKNIFITLFKILLAMFVWFTMSYFIALLAITLFSLGVNIYLLQGFIIVIFISSVICNGIIGAVAKNE